MLLDPGKHMPGQSDRQKAQLPIVKQLPAVNSCVLKYLMTEFRGLPGPTDNHYNEINYHFIGPVLRRGRGQFRGILIKLICSIFISRVVGSCPDCEESKGLFKVEKIFQTLGHCCQTVCLRGGEDGTTANQLVLRTF